MQSAPSGRRYAIVPGTATPSPDLAQRLLERTIDQPLDVSPLDPSFELPAGENTAPAFNPEPTATDHQAGDGSFPWTGAKAQRQQNHRTGSSGSKDLSEKTLEPSSHEHARRRSSLRACRAHRASLGNRRDKKRKHGASAQEHGRRYSRDVSEDTPHTSENDSDDGMKPAYRDVFEGRGRRSLTKEPAATKALDIPRSYDGFYSTPSICGISPRDTSSLGGRAPFWGC